MANNYLFITSQQFSNVSRLLVESLINAYCSQSLILGGWSSLSILSALNNFYNDVKCDIIVDNIFRLSFYNRLVLIASWSL